MNETLDSSLSTLQLEQENITGLEYQLQQKPKPEIRGPKFTKYGDKCVFCGKPVRPLYTDNYYASDCVTCHNYVKRYGLNSVEVDWIYFLQEGICANPGCNEKAGNFDHCHKTKKLREILCQGCNKGLGMLGENPQRIAGLLQYIATHSWPL